MSRKVQTFLRGRWVKTARMTMTLPEMVMKMITISVSEPTTSSVVVLSRPPLKGILLDYLE